MQLSMQNSVNQQENHLHLQCKLEIFPKYTDMPNIRPFKHPKLVTCGSIRVAKWLALSTLDHQIPGLNSA